MYCAIFRVWHKSITNVQCVSWSSSTFFVTPSGDSEVHLVKYRKMLRTEGVYRRPWGSIIQTTTMLIKHKAARNVFSWSFHGCIVTSLLYSVFVFAFGGEDERSADQSVIPSRRSAHKPACFRTFYTETDRVVVTSLVWLVTFVHCD